MACIQSQGCGKMRLSRAGPDLSRACRLQGAGLQAGLLLKHWNTSMQSPGCARPCVPFLPHLISFDLVSEQCLLSGQ